MSRQKSTNVQQKSHRVNGALWNIVVLLKRLLNTTGTLLSDLFNGSRFVMYCNTVFGTAGIYVIDCY